MIETTRPELVAYQEERLAKFVNENQKLDKGQTVFAGDSITEFFALKKILGSRFSLGKPWDCRNRLGLASRTP